MTDGRGNVSYYEYDNRSRLTKATDPNGKITQLQYDGNGNITKVTDAANAITQYAYDPRNRRTGITDSFGLTELRTWDAKGNLASYKDRKNQLTTLSYDALDRLSSITYADNTSTTFGYSFPTGGFSEMTMIEGANVITRRFDNRDRLSYEITPQGRIDYAYDAADRRTGMTVQGQPALAYTWDDSERLTAITQTVNGTARNIALAYDQANRRSKITFPGALEQRMTYSKAWGRPSAISYFAGATQLDALTDTTFDTDGRPITRTASAAATGVPNAVNTLPTAFTASYTNNRLTTLNGGAWTYDNQGNLTSDGTNAYIWDARNRLKEIKQGATTTALFEYDSLNRRTKKVIGNVTPIATEYLHDGSVPVQEKRSTDITQLITGPGIDDYLSRITTTTGATPTITIRNYLTDFLGSTVALADDSGTAAAIKTTYGYEPYGETTVSGEATSNPFQYTGRENDGTGLYYYRARYYSPKAKRFIAEDPIGQAGGINTYMYVEGDPISATDPLGLMTSQARVMALLAQGNLAEATVIAEAMGLTIAPRLAQTQTSIQNLMNRYPLASNQCEKLANGKSEAFKAAGRVTPQMLRIEPVGFRVNYVRIGETGTYAPTNHVIVRVGDMVFDASTGMQGMAYSQYINILNQINNGPTSYVIKPFTGN
jgi:RHS repeat-associated protein